jgi:hypothetical protein
LTSDNKSTATAQSDTFPPVKAVLLDSLIHQPVHESLCFFHRVTHLYLGLCLRHLPLFCTSIVLVHFDTGAIYAQLLHVGIYIENFKYLFKMLYLCIFYFSDTA